MVRLLSEFQFWRAGQREHVLISHSAGYHHTGQFWFSLMGCVTAIFFDSIFGIWYLQTTSFYLTLLDLCVCVCVNDVKALICTVCMGSNGSQTIHLSPPNRQSQHTYTHTRTHTHTHTHTIIRTTNRKMCTKHISSSLCPYRLHT